MLDAGCWKRDGGRGKVGTNLEIAGIRRTPTLILSFILYLASLVVSSFSGTTIHEANKYAYGANLGWVNWQADTNQGAWVGQLFCTGYLWSANCGWISLGHGPTNAFRYSNTSANDFGVNVEGNRLVGYAYGANIGWLAFESNGNPRVDLITGALHGHAYAANAGWIQLSNQVAYVQTEYLGAGPDSDGDTIPDSWEYSQVGGLTNLTLIGDYDGDGVKDTEEYGTDTNPDDATAFLALSDHDLLAAGLLSTLSWLSEPSRLYRLERTSGVSNQAVWVDSGLGLVAPDAGLETSRTVPEGVTGLRAYRVQAVVPLTP